ncbi:Biopolymer transport protein ExbD/TolR [Minicystis rosea]|nr:Biopolymer transport protein ExbD/TolR [Minicystis rosea]
MIHHRKLSIKGSPPAAEINITPLIDIVLVLLIIFMVVTPLLEKDIGVRVPATEQVEQHDEVPPDQLVVRIDDKGDLSINNNKVPQSEYIDRLRGLLAKKAPNDKLVFMVADDQASYGLLVSTIDGAKQAGADTIGLATQLPPADTASPAAPPTPAPAP